VIAQAVADTTAATIGYSAWLLTVQNLNQDQESYATPALEDPGSTVLTEPLPQALQATTTTFPLNDEEAPAVLDTPATSDVVRGIVQDPLLLPTSSSNVTISSVEDIFNDPTTLQGKAPADIQSVIDDSVDSGKWELGTLRQGSHQGQGMVLREVNEQGKYTGRMIQWHPGGGHHGPSPYWKVSSPKGGRLE
jgi:hypothetical protein